MGESERPRDEQGKLLPRDESSGQVEENGDDSSADARSTPEGQEDISGTPAPSVGPHTTFKREDPEERLARHEQSDTDAMGLDKRRTVVGGSYGASIGKQASLYGGFLAVLLILIVGFILLAQELDQPPKEQIDKAPWATVPDAKQIKPEPLQ